MHGPPLSFKHRLWSTASGQALSKAAARKPPTRLSTANSAEIFQRLRLSAQRFAILLPRKASAEYVNRPPRPSGVIERPTPARSNSLYNRGQQKWLVSWQARLRSKKR